MAFKGFAKADFNVFQVEGLEARMEQLKKRVRPKLETLGQSFAESLSAATGETMYPHVARHARRTVNPPKDTWVAIAGNRRGYKKHPHFQIGLWQSHVFLWFAVINEAENKEEIANRLQRSRNEWLNHLPKDFVFSKDHTKPEVGRFNEKDVKAMLERLKTVKKGEFLCGRTIEQAEAIRLSGKEWTQRISDTFEPLIPLYRTAVNEIAVPVKQ
ncbi:MAG TPA: DUF1054 domain-containing protein [Bacillales bacterium]|nr:DUF1054 domain-containing protein [Bacillales bacterium]